MPTHSNRTASLRNGLHWLMLFTLLLAGCRADQATKNWARTEFQDKPSLTLVPKVLEFRYAENRAIAFSMFRDLPDRVRTPLILTLTSLALIALVTLIWKMRNQGLLRLLPLSLILAGAVGNLQDRLTHGYVVDFVHVHWQGAWSFPIFNLADSMITVGTVLLLSVSALKPAPAQPAFRTS
ncbi:MAG: Lipoprotein signal peptidase [Fibrobacteres bacterium]|nr:Lipoprotein signal peptidase [Fibrobacterota bacterium]